MKIFVSIFELGDEQDWIRLTQDNRVQIYENELIFCLANCKDELEHEYTDLYFIDADDTFIELFLNGRKRILDLDIQFSDRLNDTWISPIFFYNRFDRFLCEIEKLFNDVYDYILDNYDECCRNYWRMLDILVELKYC